MFVDQLYEILTKHVSSGHTTFSVMPAPGCAAEPAVPCEGARWSSFYSTWVVREDRATGRRRLRLAAETLVATVERLLCTTAEGVALEGCTPAPGARSPRGVHWWPVQQLSLLAAAVAVQESGFREDVQVGRGWAKEASDDGGRGRGPGREACFMQAHPSEAWRWALYAPAELRGRAQRNEPGAREELMQTMLGHDRAALEHCWETGVRMLLGAHAHCAWAAPKQSRTWATISLYGTGTSCNAPNYGKTMARERLYYTFKRELEAASNLKSKSAAR